MLAAEEYRIAHQQTSAPQAAGIVAGRCSDRGGKSRKSEEATRRRLRDDFGRPPTQPDVEQLLQQVLIGIVRL
jgi:hypothetical protein